MVQKEIFLYFLLSLIKIIVCQITKYTLTDFHQVTYLKIVDFSVNPLNSSNKQNIITFQSAQITNPLVLIGIMQFDVNTSTNYIGYKLDYTTNGNSITISAQQQYDSVINQIEIFCLTIQHQSVYVKKGSVIIPSSNTDLVITQIFNYQKQSQNPPQISAYILGFLNKGTGNYLKVKLSVQQGQNSFNLIIERSNTCLQEVYFNYIEIYDDLNLGFKQQFASYQKPPFYLANLYEENSYEDSSQTIINNGQNAERFSDLISLQVDLVYPTVNSFNFTQVGFFIGFSYFQFDTTSKYKGLRVKIDQAQLSNNYFTFKYRVWSSSQILGIKTSYLYFGMLNCQLSYPSYPINDFINKACINQCQSDYYIFNDLKTDIQTCQPCDSSCLTCSGASPDNCLTCPTGNYLTTNNTCSICPVQCIQCTSPINCTSCNSKYPYFFNNFCYQDPPPLTYCDNQKYQCSACNAQCETCSSNLFCLTCLNNYYLLQGVCSLNQPSNSYCDPLTKICTPCNQNCGACNQSLKCLYCQNDFLFFFQGNCTIDQPPDTYCQNNISQGILNYCQQCHPACKTCTGSLISECASCNIGYFLDGNTCYCQLPNQSYDPKTQQCQNCLVNGCASCQNDINTCNQCYIQFELKNNQCICKNPEQYFDITQQRCIQNSIQNCQVSFQNQNKCALCKDGFFNYQNVMCSYCGRFKYADSNSQCKNDCQKNCIICTNSNSCVQYINSSGPNNSTNSSNSNIPYTDSRCHYSCFLCNGFTSSNCIQCNEDDNRIYNLSDSTCDCKQGFLDIGLKQCSQAIDIAEQVYKTALIGFYVFLLAIQVPFIYFDKFKCIHFCFHLIQYIIILSFLPFYQQNFYYAKLIQEFKYLGFYNLIPLGIVKTQDNQINTLMNGLTINLIIQCFSIIVFGLILLIKNNNLKKLHQIITSTSRFTSTLQIVSIIYLYLEADSLTMFQKILVMVSSIIQLIVLIIIIQIQFVEISGKSIKSQKISQNFIQNLDSSFQKNESIQESKSEKKIFFLNIYFKIRRVSLIPLFIFFSESTTPYYIYAVVSFFSILVIIYLKPFEKKIQDVVIVLTEVFVSGIFISIAYLRSYQNQVDSKIYYQIYTLMICLVSLFFILFSNVIWEIFYLKAQYQVKKLEDKDSNTNSLQIQIKHKVPEVITKGRNYLFKFYLNQLIFKKRLNRYDFGIQKVRKIFYFLQDESKFNQNKIRISKFFKSKEFILIKILQKNSKQKAFMCV